jgi:hypothetical protein
MQTLTAQPLNPATPTFQIGLTATRGGLITNDTPLNEFFKGLYITTGGDVLVRGIDNEIIPILGRLSGSFVAVLGYEVVSAATVDGQALTTTATDISWVGGF